MAIVKKEINLAKEADDVLALAAQLIKTIKNKGDYAALLPAFVLAIEGIGSVGDELKSDKQAVVNAAYLRVYEIVDALV
jgi:hypothetical protein